MSPREPTKKKNKKITINTLRQYFPSLLIKYNQHIHQLSRDIQSTDENLMPVFRTMWNTNLLLKNFIDNNGVSEGNHDKNKSFGDMKSSLKELQKIIWKLNSVLISEFQSETVKKTIQHKDI